MKRTGGHQLHMWLIGAAAAVSLLFGASFGWALALAMAACGAMFAAVLWIGRTSVQQVTAPPVNQDQDPSAQVADRRTSFDL